VTGSQRPSIDYSGRMIGFQSDQPLAPGSSGLQPNVYVTEADSNQFLRPSEQANGSPANAGSREAVLAGDGRSMVFVSSATDIDPEFTPPGGYVPVQVVYARRIDVLRASGRLSRTVLGSETSFDSLRPALNHNGTMLAFDSTEDLFGAVPQNESFADIFQRLLPDNAQVVYWSSFE
jgi:Tol biopolymer transport system component